MQTTNTLMTQHLGGLVALIAAVIIHAALNYVALGRQNTHMTDQNATADATNQLAVKANILQTDANHQATDATLHRWAPPALSGAIRQLAADSGVTPDEVRQTWTMYKAQALAIGASTLVKWFPTLKVDDARLLLEHIADAGGALVTSTLPAIEQVAAPLVEQAGAMVAALPFNSVHIPPTIVHQAEALAAGLLNGPTPLVGLSPQPTVPANVTISAPQYTVTTAAPEQLHVVESSTGEVVGTITPPTPTA